LQDLEKEDDGQGMYRYGRITWKKFRWLAQNWIKDFLVLIP
jgi:hypothetical protein